MIIDIAVARSRKAKKWQNRKIVWAELVQKLSETHRTTETLAQYNASAKDRQAEIKDIGGFVGGYLKDGRRTPVTNVLHRQLITLDIDFGTPDTVDDFAMIYGFEAVVYSTHKHTSEKPRLRLVVPLDRPVGIEEYEAICRRLADNIGMSCFDPTTFEPQRLMYWPSTARDAEYFFWHQEGPILQADSILKSYVNWKDVSEWPITDAEDLTVRSDMKKAGDPTEKPGLVGAFCRAYDIYVAIEEFLSDVYEPAGEGRMTYIGGTTAAGAVIYNEGAFLYSHHSTDPAHGKLLNSFDLVRIHKFGDLDEDKDAPLSKLKSQTEMCALASTMPSVISKMPVNTEPFGEPLEEDVDWLGKLAAHPKTGNFLPTITNIKLILENDELLKGCIGYDDFQKAFFLMKSAPWSTIDRPRLFTDMDDSGLRQYLETAYKIFHTGKTQDGINVIAEKAKFHPVREFIMKEEWDGVSRLETLLIDYLNAEDSEFVRTVTRKTFTAAVARVFNPGCKFDYVLTLIGHQGMKKSTLFYTLGGDWFSDSFSTVHGKEAYEQLQGTWIIEMAELAGLKKADIESVKHFITKRKDKFRVAYGKRVEEFPRQCIFLASTNEDDFLKDYTGNRRFWPVRISGVSDPTKMETLPVGQIWAEAKHYYDQGEKLYLEDPEMERAATLIQTRHTESDERSGVIENYLNMLLPKDWDKYSKFERRQYVQGLGADEEGVTERLSVCVAEIWTEVFGKDTGDMNTANTKYIHQIMHNIKGWQRVDNLIAFGPYGRQRGYVKTTINGKAFRTEAKEFSKN